MRTKSSLQRRPLQGEHEITNKTKTNVTSMEPVAPINEGYKFNEPEDSLPNRVCTLMEELENTQTRITSFED